MRNLRWELENEFDSFSYKHIAFNDVDPIYFLVRYANLTEEQKKRVIFTNLMIYDLGVSIDTVAIEDKDKFYDRVTEVFQQMKVGKDRKHVAIREGHPNCKTKGTMVPLMREHKPQEWIDLIMEETKQKLSWYESVKSAKMIPTFGEYFAFKTADMIETCFDIDKSHGYKVKWDKGFLKTIPRGALTGYETVRARSRSNFRKPPVVREDEEMQIFYEEKLQKFGNIPCPHKRTRNMSVLEVETLLCDFRKVWQGSLDYTEKVMKCKKAIDKNPDNIYAEGMKYPLDVMMKRREYLMNEVGIENITESHCKEDIFEWYKENKNKTFDNHFSENYSIQNGRFF